MELDLRYFASLRDTLNCAEETLTCPSTVQTMGDLRLWLAARGGCWAEGFAPSQVLRFAVEHRLVADESFELPQQSRLEIAFFPPVTGG